MTASAVWASYLFELRRSLVPQRLVFLAVLVLFPPVITALIRYAGDLQLRSNVWEFVLFALVPMVVCLLALLLQATPVIYAELEGRTFIYLAVRPAGKLTSLLGKYLAAVTWTILVATVALTLSQVIIGPADPLGSWSAFAALIVLSSLAYGSLMVLIGVLFLRKAMVVAVGYITGFEFLVSFIPAMVNQLTVQFHLRSLLNKWLELTRDPVARDYLFNDAPAWQHIAFLIGYAVVLLAAAIVILRRRELIKADEV